MANKRGLVAGDGMARAFARQHMALPVLDEANAAVAAFVPTFALAGAVDALAVVIALVGTGFVLARKARPARGALTRAIGTAPPAAAVTGAALFVACGSSPPLEALRRAVGLKKALDNESSLARRARPAFLTRTVAGS